MSDCKFPDHHSAASGGSIWPCILAAAAALAAAAMVVHLALAAWAWLTANAWLLAIPTAAIAARIVLAVSRFARAGAAGRRNYPVALWYRLLWPRWCVREGLGYRDRYRHRLLRLRFPGSPAARVEPDSPHRLVWPRAHFRPDAYGWTARIKTTPGVGRAELEKSAQHLADHWRCTRVQVAQRKPGRLAVRGLRTDPLLEPLTAVLPARGISRPFLGVDEWSASRWLDLSGITGIVITGNPGYGKTSLVLSLLDQLAGSAAVQFCFIDLKGGGDYADWSDRAWLSVGDDLADAADAISDVHVLMRKRLGLAGTDGPRNRWHVGPTEDWPLIVTVIDECHGAFDEQAVKGDKKAEGHVRTCRSLTGQLIKKGRAPLFLTILLTQKGTSDACPTALRDVCGLGISFATKTTDAAVASLGESIRKFPTVDPVTLQARPDYIGVATASLPTGADPFVRLRCPEITEQAAAERAAATAHLRRDPAVVAVPVPPLAVVPELVPEAAA